MSDAAAPAFPAGRVDEVVRAHMQEHRIPGLSLAVIDSGKIVRAQGYGFTDNSGEVPISPDILFQAGSIGKPVTAFAALQLVEQGKLALDEDVNLRLQTWRIPENEFTAHEKVTSRRLLSHSAGLTVHGFPGYAQGRPMPTLVQVLNGEPPANTKPVRVDITPGQQCRYSGGGYTVLQLLLEEVTGQPFAAWMQAAVLQPLGMSASSFAPLADSLAHTAASGHLPNGNVLPGRWHNFTEMAAASLWSTPSDLARFAMGVQEALAGKRGALLSSVMTRQMLTPQVGGFGLGVELQNSGKSLCFHHSGRTYGFDAFMLGLAEFGRGAVVMFNANAPKKVTTDILQAIIKEHWSRR